MRRRIRRIILLALAAFVLTACAEEGAVSSGSAATELTVFVSPDGSDTADGVNAPVRTVTRALAIAAENITERDVTIDIADGTYSVTAPITITEAETCREDGYVLTLQGYENSVISGGQTVTGWEREGDNIWKASLPGMETINGFYVDGARKTLAGTWIRGSFVDENRDNGIVQENKKAYQNFEDCNAFAAIVKCSFSFQNAAGLDAEALRRELDSIRMYFDQTFMRTSFAFSEVIESNGRITLVASQETLNMMNTIKMADYDRSANRYTLVNSRLFLDEEGEYFFDSGTGTLYYYSESSPEDKACVAAVSEGLLRIQGTEKALASNVVIRNLTFAYGTGSELSSHPYKAMGDHVMLGLYDGEDAEETTRRILLPGQITMDLASNITVENCRLEHCDTSGIVMLTHVYNTSVRDCHIRDIAGTGIRLGIINMNSGFGIAERNPHPEDLEHVYGVKKYSVVPAAITLSGNVVERCGLEVPGCGGIQAWYAYELRITRNTIRETGGNGIGVGSDGSNWSIKKSTTKSHGSILIEGNRVISPCMRIVDAGGIYCNGPFHGDGLVIRDNFVDMEGACRNTCWAIYLDQGAEFVTVTNNVAVNTNVWLWARALPIVYDETGCHPGEPDGFTIMNCAITGNYTDREPSPTYYASGIPWPSASEVPNANVVIENNLADRNWQGNEAIMAIVQACGAEQP